jgi:hypothetical protein
MSSTSQLTPLAKTMVEFHFVNYNDPAQTKSRDVRKFIRSHVSHVQHEQKRTELGQILHKQTRPRSSKQSIDAWKCEEGLYRDRSRSPTPQPLSRSTGSSLGTDRGSGCADGRRIQEGRAEMATARGRSGMASSSARGSTKPANFQRPQSYEPAPTASSSVRLDGDSSPFLTDPSCLHRGKRTKIGAGNNAHEEAQEASTSNQKPDKHGKHRSPLSLSKHGSGAPSRPTPHGNSSRLSYSNLRDPTDELRNWMELQGTSVSLVTVSSRS